MGQAGTLNEYLGIELPNSSEIQEPGNMLPNEEMSYNKEENKEEPLRIFCNLNSKDLNAFDSTMESIDNDLGKQVFIDGYVGIGKTYLRKAIATKQ
jgi:archaellum component FlaC